MKQLLDTIKSVASSSSSSAHQMIYTSLTSQASITGLYLHSRISNFPIELVAPLHRNLFEDILWAQKRDEEEEIEGAKDFEKMEQVLLIAQLSSDHRSSLGQKNKKEKKEKHHENGKKEEEEEGGKGMIGAGEDVTNGYTSLLFDFFDDEILLQQSGASLRMKPSFSKTSIVVALLPLSSLEKSCKAIEGLVKG